MKTITKIEEIFDPKRDLVREPITKQEEKKFLNRGIDSRFVADMGVQFVFMKDNLPWLLGISLEILKLHHQTKLERETAQRAIYLTEILLLGIETFRNRDIFIAWITSHPKGLKGLRPLDYLAQEIKDIRYVRDLLNRIANGIFV